MEVNSYVKDCKKKDVFPGRKARAGIEPASCVEGHGSIPSMPPPGDVTRNHVVQGS
nr:MAG TPA: hypothetical protein [Caudoviricetes sp.]